MSEKRRGVILNGLRGRRALALLLATIIVAALLVGAVPAARSSDDPGPLVAVVFTSASTNDDGSGGDGDDGGPPAGYDAWGGASSADPSGPGPGASRLNADVAICIAAVAAGDPGVVDVVVDNAYSGYVCTMDAVVYNGSPLPVTVAPAVIDADPGLVVQGGVPPPPVSLAPGAQANAVFTIGVASAAPQGGALLQASIAITISEEESGNILVDKVSVPAGSSQAFEFHPNWGANFLLADGDPPYDSGPLLPGTYSVAEVTPLPTDWLLTSVVCSDGSDPTAIQLDPGESVTCTFTNLHTYIGGGAVGVLTIVESALPADDTVFWFDGGSLGAFSLSDPSHPSRLFTTLEAGAYHIAVQTPSADWQFQKVQCTAQNWSAAGASVTVNLAEGEVATCTFFHTSGELPYTGTTNWLLVLLVAAALASLLGLMMVGTPGRNRGAGGGGAGRA
jgi:hypothetical protein